MKILVCSVTGVVGVLLNYLFGEFSYLLITFAVIMLIDYITGLLCAIVGRSNKTLNGGLSSSAGLKGIIKKVGMVLMVIIANRLDFLMNTAYITTGVLFSLITNELISVLENMVKLEVPIPNVIKQVLDIIKKRSDIQ